MWTPPAAPLSMRAYAEAAGPLDDKRAKSPEHAGTSLPTTGLLVVAGQNSRSNEAAAVFTSRTKRASYCARSRGAGSASGTRSSLPLAGEAVGEAVGDTNGLSGGEDEAGTSSSVYCCTPSSSRCWSVMIARPPVGAAVAVGACVGRVRLVGAGVTPAADGAGELGAGVGPELAGEGVVGLADGAGVVGLADGAGVVGLADGTGVLGAGVLGAGLLGAGVGGVGAPVGPGVEGAGVVGAGVCRCRNSSRRRGLP